jgi:hypothetical protein
VCGVPLDLFAFSESNKHNSIRGFRYIKVDQEMPDNNVRGKNTGFQGFEIFMDLLIPNYEMCRKLVQMVEGLIDFLYNFFALMEKVDSYIRSYKRHVYSLRPWGFEFRCIKRRVNLMLNVKGSVTFATQKCIGVPSPYTIRTYVTMKHLTYFLYALCTF